MFRQHRIYLKKFYIAYKLFSYGKIDFTKVSKNLDRYRSKNNFVRLSK